MDLCVSCIDDSASREDYVHDKTHSLIKYNHVVHDYYKKWQVPMARIIVDRVKARLRDIASSLAPVTASVADSHGSFQTNQAGGALLCACCEKVVSTPCWACVWCRKCDFDFISFVIVEHLLDSAGNGRLY